MLEIEIEATCCPGCGAANIREEFLAPLQGEIVHGEYVVNCWDCGEELPPVETDSAH